MIAMLPLNKMVAVNQLTHLAGCSSPYPARGTLKTMVKEEEKLKHIFNNTKMWSLSWISESLDIG